MLRSRSALLVALPVLAAAAPRAGAAQTPAVPAACRTADAGAKDFFADHREVQSAALTTRDWRRNGAGSAVQGRVRMRQAAGLPDLALGTFRAPQAVAFLRLDQDAKVGANASLGAGTYCLVAQYLGAADDPDDAKETTRRNPDNWRLYLFDVDGATTAPVARMQFVYRVEHATEAVPATRFLSLSSDEIAGAIPEGVSRRYFVGRSAQRTLADVGTQGLFGPWFMCGDGCCTGAFDGLELMR